MSRRLHIFDTLNRYIIEQIKLKNESFYNFTFEDNAGQTHVFRYEDNILYDSNGNDISVKNIIPGKFHTLSFYIPTSLEGPYLFKMHNFLEKLNSYYQYDDVESYMNIANGCAEKAATVEKKLTDELTIEEQKYKELYKIHKDEDDKEGKIRAISHEIKAIKNVVKEKAAIAAEKAEVIIEEQSVEDIIEEQNAATAAEKAEVIIKEHLEYYKNKALVQLKSLIMHTIEARTLVGRAILAKISAINELNKVNITLGGKLKVKGKSNKNSKKPVASQKTQNQYKEILGKRMKIYKMPDSRKEYVKYKGELYHITDYKNIIKQITKAKNKK